MPTPITAGAQGRMLSDLTDRVRAGLEDIESRVRALAERRAADQAAVRDALKAASAKRLVDSDPVLKERLAAAEAVFKAEQQRTGETQDRLADIAKLAEAELARLQKLLG